MMISIKLKAIGEIDKMEQERLKEKEKK